MAKRTSLSIDAFLLLQLVLALYLIFLGIQGINNYNSSLNELKRSLASLFGKSNNPVSLVFAIAQIVAGGVLAVSAFLPGIGTYLNFAAALFWIVQLVYSNFFIRMAVEKDALAFKPDFPGWLVMLLADLIILISLWLVARRRA